MKKLIALAGIAVLTLSLSGAAIAQKANGQTQKAGHHHAQRHGALRGILKQKLAEKLDLTSAQKEKIHVLNEQFKAQLKGLKDSKLEKEAKKKQAKSMIKQHRENILGVLTPAQKAKLPELKKNHKRPARRGGGGV